MHQRNLYILNWMTHSYQIYMWNWIQRCSRGSTQWRTLSMLLLHARLNITERFWGEAGDNLSRLWMADLARLYTNGCPHQHQCHIGSENVGKTGWGRSSDVVGTMMTKSIRGRGNSGSRSKSILEELQMRESVTALSLTTRAPICISRPPPWSAGWPRSPHLPSMSPGCSYEGGKDRVVACRGPATVQKVDGEGNGCVHAQSRQKKLRAPATPLATISFPSATARAANGRSKILLKGMSV